MRGAAEIASAPLVTPPRSPTPQAKFIKSDLKLTKDDLYLGNITSVAGTILARLVMGTVCDVMGARKGLAFCLFLTSPFILGIMFVTNAAGFIACRLFIGCGLASFVACQAPATSHHPPPTSHHMTPRRPALKPGRAHTSALAPGKQLQRAHPCVQVWCTQQFSKKIVGLANATAGGWGNLGGGVTNLTMVFIFQGAPPPPRPPPRPRPCTRPAHSLPAHCPAPCALPCARILRTRLRTPHS